MNKFNKIYKQLLSENIYKIHDDTVLIGLHTNACTYISDLTQYSREEAVAEGWVEKNDVIQMGMYIHDTLPSFYIQNDQDILKGIDTSIDQLMDYVNGHWGDAEPEEQIQPEYVKQKLTHEFKKLLNLDIRGEWYNSAIFYGVLLDPAVVRQRQIHGILSTQDTTGLEDLF
jgi:hypothetical protein